MRFVKSLSLCLIFISHSISADSPEWQLLPQVCLVDSFAEECRMQLQITVKNIDEPKYCLFQDEKLLGCWEIAQMSITVPVSFTQRTVISLRNIQGKTLLKRLLSVKARREKKQRRRIKQPWSLF